MPGVGLGCDDSQCMATQVCDGLTAEHELQTHDVPLVTIY